MRVEYATDDGSHVKLNKLRAGETFKFPRGDVLYMKVEHANGVAVNNMYVSFEGGELHAEIEAPDRPVIKVNAVVRVK